MWKIFMIFICFNLITEICLMWSSCLILSISMGIELGYGCRNQIYMWVLRNIFKYGFCEQCMDLVIVFGSGECGSLINGWVGGYGGQQHWVEKERHRGERDRERKNKKWIGLWWLISVGLWSLWWLVDCYVETVSVWISFILLKTKNRKQ